MSFDEFALICTDLVINMLSQVKSGLKFFFSIFLMWFSLEAHTAIPYTLALKSNRCTIFIGVLSSSKLVITSKHSLGPGRDKEIHYKKRFSW